MQAEGTTKDEWKATIASMMGAAWPEASMYKHGLSSRRRAETVETYEARLNWFLNSGREWFPENLPGIAKSLGGACVSREAAAAWAAQDLWPSKSEGKWWFTTIYDYLAVTGKPPSEGTLEATCRNHGYDYHLIFAAIRGRYEDLDEAIMSTHDAVLPWSDERPTPSAEQHRLNLARSAVLMLHRAFEPTNLDTVSEILNACKDVQEIENLQLQLSLKHKVPLVKPHAEADETTPRPTTKVKNKRGDTTNLRVKVKEEADTPRPSSASTATSGESSNAEREKICLEIKAKLAIGRVFG